jgi:NarL family two-component system sensor histidine kinase LiaS
VHLDLPEICLLPSSIEEALWRGTQEVLSNIARHSKASAMYLYLKWTEQDASLSISDNGQGFDVASQEGKGLGLRSIRERVEQVGGSLQIHSAAGMGTQVVMRCSLAGQTTHAPAEKELST